MPVSMGGLVNLSDLSAHEMAIFREKWPAVPARRRGEIMKKLVQLAEENFELNFDRVFAACTGDPEAAIRVRAAEGLGDSEDPAYIEALARLLENDDEVEVRVAAARFLAGYSMMAAHNRLRPRQVDRVAGSLLAAINNKGENIDVRRRALESAGPLCLPEVKSAMRDAYEGNIHLLRVSAIYAMGQNCDPQWLPLLLEELYSPNPESRYEAATACGELGQDEAVAHLAPLTRDPDFQVRMAAVDALGKIGGEESRETLKECARSDDPRMSEAAREALEHMEGDENPLSFNTNAIIHGESVP